MRKQTILTIILSIGLVFLSHTASFGEGFEHIKRLFELRESIGEQGRTLPTLIRSASGNDIRTLERIFELNTSALTTIEAYFRIFKMAISTQNIQDPATILILDEWLTFMGTQCKFDIEYLDEASSGDHDQKILKQLNISKKNIVELSTIAKIGVKENQMPIEE